MSVHEFIPRSLLHGVQAIRGIFALLIVCHHVGVNSERHWKHDWLGGVFNQSTFRVDFFFVLSGFVVWNAHRADAGTLGGWRTFLMKRLQRLYPLLVTLTLAKALVLWLVPGRSLQTFNLAPSLLALPQATFPVIVAAWTLSFEVCFTLVLTACIAMKLPWSVRALVSWGGLMCCAGVFFGIRPSLHGLGFLTHPFFLEFVSGVLTTEWLRRRSGHALLRNRRLSMGLCGISILGLIMGAMQHSWVISQHIIFQKLFWAVVFALGLGGLALWERSVATKDWRFKDVLGLGRASYSIFLAHGFVLMAVFALMRPAALPVSSAGKDALLVLAMILSVLFGMAVWKWLERPLTRWCSFTARPPCRLLARPPSSCPEARAAKPLTPA